MSEGINHPPHYNMGKIEVIDFIEDQRLDFHLGNAIKYICRADHKNPDRKYSDLEKAVWYIQRVIDNAENKLPTNPPKKQVEIYQAVMPNTLNSRIPR
jgi:hypothetical protein